MKTKIADSTTNDRKLRDFGDAVILGLASEPKRLACKYFYDERGSQLFDRICELDEYYVMRTERAIMREFAAEMGEQIGSGVMLVEYGSGSSLKTRILLDHLPQPAAYVPVDISKDHLHKAANRIAVDYPHIEVLPVCADFTQPFELPAATCEPTHSAVYFPGSTIGNFVPEKAAELLARIVPLCGAGGGLLIGVDLQKDKAVLERAYNDREGVTAEFNLNLLHRIRDELESDLDPSGFDHHSFYNEKLGRIEIYVRSKRKQSYRVNGRVFEFDEGELIHTEYSHKYTVEGFAELAARAGLKMRKAWTDDRNYFAVIHLVVDV